MPLVGLRTYNNESSITSRRKRHTNKRGEYLPSDTDDRGVFATTVYNEFSLLALSMMKQKDNDANPLYGTRQIMEYIEHLRQTNEMQRFKGNV